MVWTFLLIQKKNYDGYKFSIDGVENLYNSNMCLFFFNNYLDQGKIPEQEAKIQIKEYAEFEEIKEIPYLRKYTVIAVNDKIFVENIV